MKSSIDNRTMLLQFLPLSSTKSCYGNVFLPIYNDSSEQNPLGKPAFNNVSRLNLSSLMNNSVKSKIKHFIKLFVLGPQIALKRKCHYFLSWQTITASEDIYLYNIKIITFVRVYCKLSAWSKLIFDSISCSRFLASNFDAITEPNLS